jgi:hypothetical protein
MKIPTIDGFINTDAQADYNKIYEQEMQDYGYINLTTEKQFNRIKEIYND